MKYYKVQVELGHMGCGKSLAAWIYVKAKTITHAIEIAQNLPAVKHTKLPSQAIQINKEEYEQGIKSRNYNEKIDQIFGV